MLRSRNAAQSMMSEMMEMKMKMKMETWPWLSGPSRDADRRCAAAKSNALNLAYVPAQILIPALLTAAVFVLVFVSEGIDRSAALHRPHPSDSESEPLKCA
jgi:hypothetical protein